MANRSDHLSISFIYLLIPFLIVVVLAVYATNLVLGIKDIETRAIHATASWHKFHQSTEHLFTFRRHGLIAETEWNANRQQFENSLNILDQTNVGILLNDEIIDRIEKSQQIWFRTSKNFESALDLYREIMFLFPHLIREPNKTISLGTENNGIQTAPTPTSQLWRFYRLEDRLTDFDVASQGLTGILEGIATNVRTRSQLLTRIIGISALVATSLIIAIAFYLARGAELENRRLRDSLEQRVEERTAKLLKSERGLANAQHLAHIGSWEWDVQQDTLRWSEETFHLFEIDPNEGEPDFEGLMSFIHPDDSDNLRAAVTTSMEQGKSLDIEYKIITNKGYTRVAHALGEVIKNDDGHPLYMFGTIQDITERKHSEETLRKLFRALEQSPNAVFITDLQGTIEYINPKFTEITGYTQEESLGQNPRILKSEKTSKELYNNLWRTIRRGEEWKSEIMDKRKDGSHFWAYETIAPVKDDHGLVTHYIATHEDISERKDSEFAIKTALEHADIANRAKSELLANMSHELRTPLNAIIGFSGAIKMEAYGPIGNDKYRDYVSDIASSGQHLLELINDILDVSAIEAGMVELQEGDIEIPNIVESSIRLVKHRAEQGEIELNINVDDSLPMLHADERRIKQILLNLLSNAIKFTQPGGEVSLNATLDENNGHVFTVSDTGIGMNNNEQAKAMKQFSQVDSGLNRTQEGTGLGLPLTLGLVELHGGTLDIDSTKDEGTRVTVRFSQERTIVS